MRFTTLPRQSQHLTTRVLLFSAALFVLWSGCSKKPVEKPAQTAEESVPPDPAEVVKVIEDSGAIVKRLDLRSTDLPEVPNITFVDLGTVDLDGETFEERQESAAKLFEALAKLPNLMRLVANIPEVTDEAVKHFEGNDSVITLDLQQSNITDEGVKSLAEMTALRELVLANTNAGAEGMKAFEGHEELRVLVLISTKVDNAALQSIGKIPNLIGLQLANVEQITDEGIPALTNLKNLKTLQLEHQDLTDEAAKSVAEIKSLEELSMAKAYLTEDGIKALATLPKLRTLDLMDSYAGDEFFPHLAKIENLEQLNLRATAITGEGISALEPLPLRVLNVRENGITPEAVDAIAKFDGLINLNLDTNPGLEGYDFSKLAALKDLEALSLRKLNLTDEQLGGITEIESLRSLSVGQNSELTADGLRKLTELPVLEVLDISNTVTDPAKLEAVKKDLLDSGIPEVLTNVGAD